LVDDAEKKYFSMLPVGQAIVKLQDRWRRPFLIKAPLVEVRKGLVTDELLGRFVKGSLTAAGLRRAVNRAFGRAGTELAHGTVLDQAALDFLGDVMEHEDDSVRMRYKRLHISVDKGNGLKSRLIQSGILEEQEVKVGRTYKYYSGSPDAVEAWSEQDGGPWFDRHSTETPAPRCFGERAIK
jgi:hypothetical protein